MPVSHSSPAAALMPGGDRESVLIVEYDEVPRSVVVEARRWPSLADTLSCRICPEGCTATALPNGAAMCVLLRPAVRGDKAGEGEGEASPCDRTSADGGRPSPAGRRPSPNDRRPSP